MSLLARLYRDRTCRPTNTSQLLWENVSGFFSFKPRAVRAETA